MSKRKYKFTNKRHSVGGVLSSLMALSAVVLIVIAVIISFKAGGYGGEEVGTLSLMALVFSASGLVLGLLSYRETDRYYSFSFAGSLVSGIVTVLLVMLFFTGI